MYSNSDKKPRKIRSLSSNHREKISLAHKGKKKSYSLSTRKRTIISPTWVYKPVICINTEKIFNSLAAAAEEVYKNKRSYSYISDVCKGFKAHYKRMIWRYEEDYISLSEIDKAILKKKCFELNKTFIKHTTKLLYMGKVYTSFADLGLILHTDDLLSYRDNTREDLSKLLSTIVGATKRNQCPFIILKNQYVFFADYEVLCKDPRGAFKISEKPITKTVEEIHDCYIKHLDKVIGDMTIGELLHSSKDTFYKLGTMYFKNQCNIKKFSCNEIIDKKTLIYLKDNSNYKFLFNIETYDLTNTTKNKFYMKNNYIFLNKQDYINRFIRLLTKKEVINELNILD